MSNASGVRHRTARLTPSVGPTEAFVQLGTLLEDVDYILSLHPKADGTSGKPSKDAAPIARSAVLLTYAAWEVYIEESLIEVAEWMASRSVELLPEATRDYISKRAKADPWELVSHGWEHVLVEQVKAEARGIGDGDYGLNNATSGEVVGLQRKVLGFSPLEQAAWTNASNVQLRAKLATFVSLRGEIAHTARNSGKLWAGQARVWRKWIPKLANEVDYRLRLWMSIQSDETNDWWPIIAEALADGTWKTGKDLQIACGVKRHHSTPRNEYNTFLAFTDRRVDVGALERSGGKHNPVYRLPDAPEPEPEALFELNDEGPQPVS